MLTERSQFLIRLDGALSLIVNGKGQGWAHCRTACTRDPALHSGEGDAWGRRDRLGRPLKIEKPGKANDLDACPSDAGLPEELHGPSDAGLSEGPRDHLSDARGVGGVLRTCHMHLNRN